MFIVFPCRIHENNFEQEWKRVQVYYNIDNIDKNFMNVSFKSLLEVKLQILHLNEFFHQLLVGTFERIFTFMN